MRDTLSSAYGLDTYTMDANEHLDRANELKVEGNELFKATKWNEALVSYRTALSQLPPRKQSAKSELDQADIDSPESRQQPPTGDPSGGAVSDIIPNALDLECAKARAVLYANIGACLSKLVSRARLVREPISSEQLGRKTTKEW